MQRYISILASLRLCAFARAGIFCSLCTPCLCGKPAKSPQHSQYSAIIPSFIRQQCEKPMFKCNEYADARLPLDKTLLDPHG